MAIKHTGMCDICAKKKATDTHHLVYSTANRQLSDEDSLTLEICRDCHSEIHKGKNGTAGHISKMLGQALWERDYLQKNPSATDDEIRSKYISRYGKSNF